MKAEQKPSTRGYVRSDIASSEPATFFWSSWLALAAAAWLAGCSTAGPASPSYPRASAVPATSAEAHSQIATASWYGRGFNGSRTASGEVFHDTNLTAASKTLPLGSHVKVTNLASGRSVVVRINDRGPFVSGRSIDLSRTAAERIGMAREGVGPVKIARLRDNSGAGLSAPVGSSVSESYAHLSDTSSATSYRDWAELPRDWVWRVKTTLHHSQYRRQSHHNRDAGVVAYQNLIRSIAADLRAYGFEDSR